MAGQTLKRESKNTGGGSPKKELGRAQKLRRLRSSNSASNSITAMPDLSSFPALSKPLVSSKLVGLYFASSWCPDCTPITPQLKSVYANAQPKLDFHSTESIGDEKKTLEVVYVSSDETAEQMTVDMVQNHGEWSAVPFNDAAQRAALKQHFGACAGKEADGLGMGEGGKVKKRFGIPTLIILDGESGDIVTTEGVKDLEETGNDALAAWMKIRQDMELAKRKKEQMIKYGVPAAVGVAAVGAMFVARRK